LLGSSSASRFGPLAEKFSSWPLPAPRGLARRPRRHDGRGKRVLEASRPRPEG